MLYAGLDLSRPRLDVHVLDEEDRTLEVMAVHPDADALRILANRVLRHGQEVSAVIESMTGSRLPVRDEQGHKAPPDDSACPCDEDPHGRRVGQPGTPPSAATSAWHHDDLIVAEVSYQRVTPDGVSSGTLCARCPRTAQ